jgi:hypothetical protein
MVSSSGGKVSVDVPLYSVSVSDYRRTDDRIVFDVYFNNETADDLSVVFKSWPASQAFDEEGNDYRVYLDGSDIFKCVTGKKKKVSMYINHVSANTDKFSGIDISLFVYDVNKTETKSHIKIKDVIVK